MDFNEFKREWSDVMLHKPSEFDYEETLNELYAEYKLAIKNYDAGLTVKGWCNYFHADCDLDTHPYMLKSKAINTHHGNSLKIMSNKQRERVGIPLLPLIEKPLTPFEESLKLLRDLADLQNGAPLEQHRKEWEETIEQVYIFLNKHEKS